MTAARSVLLVDDNPAEVELALTALKLIGCRRPIVVARDGVEALDYLFAHGAHANRAMTETPGYVLLDLKLPKVSGLEVLRKVRVEPALQEVFVAVLTSSSEEKDRAEAVRLGADLYLRKALDFTDFVTDLREIEAQASARGR